MKIYKDSALTVMYLKSEVIRYRFLCFTRSDQNLSVQIETWHFKWQNCADSQGDQLPTGTPKWWNPVPVKQHCAVPVISQLPTSEQGSNIQLEQCTIIWNAVRVQGRSDGVVVLCVGVRQARAPSAKVQNISVLTNVEWRACPNDQASSQIPHCDYGGE